MLAQPSWDRICLNIVFVLKSTCLCASCHVYAQIHCLCTLCRDVLVCSMPCSCVQIYMSVAMPCASLAFLSLDISLSCVLALQIGCRSRSCGLGLHPYTQAYIKGFGSFPLCMCVLACFYVLYPCLPVQIQALPCFAPFMGLCLSVFGATCSCGCIHPSCGLFGVSACKKHLHHVGVLNTHIFPLRAMLCLPYLLLCFISTFVCLDLGFAMICALHGFVLIDLWGHLLAWLHLSLL